MGMRIIAGSARGRIIEAPRGEHTRPTIDRVRESLMSSVISCVGDFNNACVCDAFAGSGALGLEAVSRGAGFAVLCDMDKEALKVIRKNVDTLKFHASTRVVSQDVLERGLPAGPSPYNVVFLDPPYATDPKRIERLITSAISTGKLANGCLISYEHDSQVGEVDIDFISQEAGLEHIRTKRYGQTFLDYFYV